MGGTLDERGRERDCSRPWTAGWQHPMAPRLTEADGVGGDDLRREVWSSRGELTGDFLVLDAASGKELYRVSTSGLTGGGVVSYEVKGKQYVAVMSGRPSQFLTGAHPGSPTAFVFAIP